MIRNESNKPKKERKTFATMRVFRPILVDTSINQKNIRFISLEKNI